MFKSFFSIFNSPQIQHETPQVYTPGNKIVLDQDHNEFVKIDLKKLSYAEVAELSTPYTSNPTKTTHTTHITTRQPKEDNKSIPYSDSVVDDIHYNDKINRTKKKNVHRKYKH